MLKQLKDRPGFWTGTGPSIETVLSTRVRLARNLPAIPFPHRMTTSEALMVWENMRGYLQRSDLSPLPPFLEMDSLSFPEKRFLRERNLITSEMEENEYGAVIFDREQKFSILINEEDHVRVQVLRPGLQPLDAYQEANRLDDSINRDVPFVFTDDLGYLTACPSNVGTGLKVSGLLHLPALVLKRRSASLMGKVEKNGFSILRLGDESTRQQTGLFLISSRGSLGVSEYDLIETFDELVSRIIELEDTTRDELYGSSRHEIEDMIWRSYGIMTHARNITYSEAMEHLSNVRLGVILAVIRNISIQEINDLMVTVQPYHLDTATPEEDSMENPEGHLRAAFIRKKLTGGGGA
jgi:protein arginine kinase